MSKLSRDFLPQEHDRSPGSMSVTKFEATCNPLISSQTSHSQPSPYTPTPPGPNGSSPVRPGRSQCSPLLMRAASGSAAVPGSRGTFFAGLGMCWKSMGEAASGHSGFESPHTMRILQLNARSNGKAERNLGGVC